MLKEEIEALIISTLSSLYIEYAIEFEPLTENSIIYGTREGISSLMLVRLIVDLEESIDIKTNKNITIADEKILSMNNSPFAHVGALTQYLYQLILENNL